MQCEDVARILPEAVDRGTAVEDSVQRHVETCLRCQAELARYRKMLRGLHLLRTRYLEPTPGLLAQTLATIEVAGEREARRAILSGRASPTPAPSAAQRWQQDGGHGRDRAPLAGRPSRRGLTGPVAHTPGPGGTAGGSEGCCYPRLRPEHTGGRWRQLVEHRSPKPAVGGSTLLPLQRTVFGTVLAKPMLTTSPRTTTPCP